MVFRGFVYLNEFVISGEIYLSDKWRDFFVVINVC